jgi:hypothetical protein
MHAIATATAPNWFAVFGGLAGCIGAISPSIAAFV